jgi:long-chain acyl-CoA synthetase
LNSVFLPDWLWAHAATRSESPALATPSQRLSYAELAARVRRLASHLVASGVTSGGRVLIALPNGAPTVVAGLAVLETGATAVEVNREWSAEVLTEIAAQTGARHAIVWGRDLAAWATIHDAAGFERLWVAHPRPLGETERAALRGAPHALLFDDGMLDPALDVAARAIERRGVEAESPALILYTSGSTGRPRGVVQTFRNIERNTRSIVQYLGLEAGDRAMLVLPLHYCYGRSVLQTHLFAGGSVFLDGRFAFPGTVLEALAAEGCTGFAGVPLTFEILRRQVDVAGLALPRLRYVTQAGGALSPETLAWARSAFHPARFYVMYGQTEATSRLSYLPPERAAQKPGSIGIPIPGVELKVVDDEGGDMPAGEVGNLVARGDNVTPGYFGEPEETAAILRGGWLWTGDLARRDAEGFFFHCGRSKEILKIGGHRVSPAEIEVVIARHPDIAEAAVVGTPHALMGEAPTAFVIVRPGRTPSESEIKAYCRQRMPAYSVPVTVRFIERLPRNAAGKLLRAALTGEASKSA